MKSNLLRMVSHFFDYKSKSFQKLVHAEQQVSFTEEQLFEAVLKGDLERVKEILTDPDIDINSKKNDE